MTQTITNAIAGERRMIRYQKRLCHGAERSNALGQTLMCHSRKIHQTEQRNSLHGRTLWSWNLFRQDTRARIQSDLERLLKEEAGVEEQKDLIDEGKKEQANLQISSPLQC